MCGFRSGSVNMRIVRYITQEHEKRVKQQQQYEFILHILQSLVSYWIVLFLLHLNNIIKQKWSKGAI